MNPDDDKAVVLVLARAGSKRVPQKNIKRLNGKPLIAYTLEAALASECFADIVVSTDDERVREISIASGVDIDERPQALCGDAVRAVEVVEEYLVRTSAAQRYRHVAMMLPTCPFRSMGDVRGAMQAYRTSAEPLPLLTVAAYEFPPQLALEPEEGHVMRMTDSQAYAATTRSQSISPRFHPNGGLYVAPIELFLRERSFFTPRMLTYPMPAERSFDIDYPWQFELAEHWARSLDAERSGSSD